MSILVDQLQEALDNEVFVEIYRDDLDCGESESGYVAHLSEGFVSLIKFTSAGYYDGLIIMDVDDITRVRIGGTKLESQEKLVEKNATIPDMPEFEMSSLEEIIEQVGEHYECVTVFIEDIDEDICFVGEVVEIDEDYLVLNEYGTMSRLDRNTGVFRMDDITRVDVDGQYEKNLQHLHDQQEE